MWSIGTLAQAVITVKLANKGAWFYNGIPSSKLTLEEERKHEKDPCWVKKWFLKWFISTAGNPGFSFFLWELWEKPVCYSSCREVNISWDILASIVQSSTNSCFIFLLNPNLTHFIKNVCMHWYKYTLRVFAFMCQNMRLMHSVYVLMLLCMSLSIPYVCWLPLCSCLLLLWADRNTV